MSERQNARDDGARAPSPDVDAGEAVAHDDPLAELARIVAGGEIAVAAPAPTEPMPPIFDEPVQEVGLEALEMDLESQLMAELGGAEPVETGVTAEAPQVPENVAAQTTAPEIAELAAEPEFAQSPAQSHEEQSQKVQAQEDSFLNEMGSESSNDIKSAGELQFEAMLNASETVVEEAVEFNTDNQPDAQIAVEPEIEILEPVIDELELEDAFSDAIAEELLLDKAVEFSEELPSGIVGDDVQVPEFGGEIQTAQTVSAIASQVRDFGAENVNEIPPKLPPVASAELDLGQVPDMLDPEQQVIIEPASGNSGFRLTAIALGLAVVVGAGVVGFGFVGGSDETTGPELVRAEPGDFKVKPENPGGREIANQDEPVYDTMSGGTNNTNAGSTQEKLVSVSEEPVDVNPVKTSAVRPEKSAERLDVGEPAIAQNAANSVMQPRRVKTVTVRADGTIVTSSGEQVAGLGSTATPDNSSVANSANSVNSAGATNAESVTPAALNAPIPKPATRSQNAQNAVTNAVEKPAVRAPKKPETVASLPRAAPAATQQPAAGRAYVVQISSQRTRVAAEASYKNLKRRFSRLLTDQPNEIQEATVTGKGTFFRVRIPIGTRSAATNFCGRYKSAGGSCFVTR